MRLQGRVIDWRDEKGFGFIRPHDGHEQAFVHISEFSKRSRRPVQGDLVTYELGRDSKGRIQARNVLFVGDGIRCRPARRQRQFEFYLFIAIVIFLPAMLVLGRLSEWVLAVYAGASVLTFLLYQADKSAARQRRWRTPESTLHALALAGGWPGAILAQEWLRHKSSKRKFRTVFWFTVGMNLLVLVWLLTDSGAVFVADLMSLVG